MSYRVRVGAHGRERLDRRLDAPSAFELVLPISALIALVLLLAGCGASAASPRSTAPRRVAYVTMLDHSGSDEFVYSPRTLKVHVGTRVVWRNHSLQPHTVTATGTPPAFDSGTQRLINRGHTWSHVFRKSGTYHYYCLLHPYMKGTIVVQP